MVLRRLMDTEPGEPREPEILYDYIDLELSTLKELCSTHQLSLHIAQAISKTELVLLSRASD